MNGKELYLARKKQTKKKNRKNRIADGIRNVAFVVGAVILAYALACAIPTNSDRGHNVKVPYNELQNVVVPDELPEIKKDYTGFKVSFNKEHHLPNYVVWEITAEEVNGTEPRKSNFHQDRDVLGCPTLDDYRNSGFDRGHMAPAADMKWSPEAMYDCHALTNICPQDKQINTGRWNTTELLTRKWAARDSILIVIAGPILTDEITRTIGQTEVSVPERFFKVIFAPGANPPRAIGFIIPNLYTELGVEDLAVSVDEVEAATGFDFFSALPDSLENEIEKQARFRIWQAR